MTVEKIAPVIAGAISALAGVYLSHRFEWIRTIRHKEIEQLQAYFSILEQIRIELSDNATMLLEFFYHSERIIQEYGSQDGFDHSPEIKKEWGQLLISEGPYQFPNWPGWEVTHTAYEQFIKRSLWQMSETETQLAYKLSRHYRLIKEWNCSLIRERAFMHHKSGDFSVGQSMENTVWQCKVCIEQLPDVGTALDRELEAVASKYSKANRGWLQRVFKRETQQPFVKIGPIGRENNWSDYKSKFDSINVRNL